MCLCCRPRGGGRAFFWKALWGPALATGLPGSQGRGCDEAPVMSPYCAHQGTLVLPRWKGPSEVFVGAEVGQESSGARPLSGGWRRESFTHPDREGPSHTRCIYFRGKSVFYVVPAATCDGQAVLRAPAPPRVSVPVGLHCPVLRVGGQSLGVSELRTAAHPREVLPGRARPTQPWATCTHWASRCPEADVAAEKHTGVGKLTSCWKFSVSRRWSCSVRRKWDCWQGGRDGGRVGGLLPRPPPAAGWKGLRGESRGGVGGVGGGEGAGGDKPGGCSDPQMPPSRRAASAQQARGVTLSLATHLGRDACQGDSRANLCSPRFGA